MKSLKILYWEKLYIIISIYGFWKAKNIFLSQPFVLIFLLTVETLGTIILYTTTFLYDKYILNCNSTRTIIDYFKRLIYGLVMIYFTIGYIAAFCPALIINNGNEIIKMIVTLLFIVYLPQINALHKSYKK